MRYDRKADCKSYAIAVFPRLSECWGGSVQSLNAFRARSSAYALQRFVVVNFWSGALHARVPAYAVIVASPSCRHQNTQGLLQGFYQAASCSLHQWLEAMQLAQSNPSAAR